MILHGKRSFAFSILGSIFNLFRWRSLLAIRDEPAMPVFVVGSVMVVPHWLTASAAFVLLLAFIGFALRQGLKVKPDKDNPDNWPGIGGGYSGDGSSHSSDGHS